MRALRQGVIQVNGQRFYHDELAATVADAVEVRIPLRSGANRVWVGKDGQFLCWAAPDRAFDMVDGEGRRSPPGATSWPAKRFGTSTRSVPVSMVWRRWPMRLVCHPPPGLSRVQSSRAGRPPMPPRLPMRAMANPTPTAKPCWPICARISNAMTLRRAAHDTPAKGPHHHVYSDKTASFRTPRPPFVETSVSLTLAGSVKLIARTGGMGWLTGAAVSARPTISSTGSKPTRRALAFRSNILC
ncbi:MAG: Mu transposase C-terminal domain-containing protein [Rhodobacteraceae bacterium]|nr:Mu transposase C-terminal domain-containing protein [Paracoccaceae bacterium]